MTQKILFVDDEPNILAGFERLFRKDYQFETATSGGQGLVKLVESGPYAVVLSDMRMPVMSGAEFLARVRDVSPETIRMVLTGETDIASAVKAVNEGAIFRFLLKPCAEPILRGALDAALRQYQLQQAEQQLLEKTLAGSIKVLTEVLSLVNPVAFGRSVRIQRYVRHAVEKLHITDDRWQFEVAAMLSQIGCVTVPPQMLEAAKTGDALTEADRQRLMMHASIAHDLLAHVPRLETVATMICRQHDPVSGLEETDPVAFGAQLLKVAIGFDERVSAGQTAHEAVAAMRTRPQEYAPRVVEAFTDVRLEGSGYQPRVLAVGRLEVGMIVDQDVLTQRGAQLAVRGQEITFAMLVRLQNFHRNGAIGDTVRVRVRASSPTPAAAESERLTA